MAPQHTPSQQITTNHNKSQQRSPFPHYLS
jgi:hypothetical protein